MPRHIVNPSAQQARYLADSLEAVAERLSRQGSLDDLLRVLDLGDRLARLEPDDLDDPHVADLAAAAAEARPQLVAKIGVLVDDDIEWEPLDALGDAVADGEGAEFVVQWGMALLRLANALEDLPAGARQNAADVLRRGLDRLDLAPGHFLSLVSLAADRIELEPPDRQPKAVQVLLDHMVVLPAVLAEDRERDQRPIRIDLARKLLAVQAASPVVVESAEFDDEPGGIVVLLRASTAVVRQSLAADSGARVEPPPDAWVTVWHGDAGSLSMAEITDPDGHSSVLLSVVLGMEAPKELSLSEPGSVIVVDAEQQVVAVSQIHAESEEWRGQVPGDVDLIVRLPWVPKDIHVRFDRPLASP